MRFKLTGQHYMHDQLLEEGTVVGEGTPYPLTDRLGRPVPPSDQMEGLDEESIAAVEIVKAKAWNIDQIMVPMGADPTASLADPIDPSVKKGK